MRAGIIFEWLGRKPDRPASESELVLLPVDSIRPGRFQPRRSIDQVELDELANSIRELGVLQPVVVRPLENGYELVMGERRWRAAKLAGLDHIPAIVRPLSDQDTALAALAENLQREDLSYWDEAASYDRFLKTFGVTQEELAKALGKSQSTIANKIRLLKLPEELRRQIQAAGLGERHARALLRLPDKVAQFEVLEKIVEEQLSASAAEELVSRVLRGEWRRSPDPEDKDGIGEETETKTRRLKNPLAKLKAIQDVRILLNTFRQGIETLRQAGLVADMESEEQDDHIEIRIRIPKEPKP